MFVQIAEARAANRAARAQRASAIARYHESKQDFHAEQEHMKQRRIRASHQWLEDTIAVGQRRGLTPSKVSHYADGSIEVHFEAHHVETRKNTQGWDI